MAQRFSPTRLRDLRIQAGFTQTDLASRAGRAYPTLRSWETGVRSPSSAAVAALADALGVGVAELFESAEVSA